jgi:hypothetical protein
MDFQGSLQAFLDALFGWISDLLNGIFSFLAAFFGGAP